MKKAWKAVVEFLDAVFGELSMLPQRIAEERQARLEDEKARQRSAWEFAQKQKTRGFEAQGRAA
jgi:hypothetical protein